VEPVARVPFRLEADPGVVRGDIRFPTGGRSSGTPRVDRSTVPPDGLADTALVVCHGFKGFKDWGFFPAVCEELAIRVGCPVISINFSGSGVGPDLGIFSDAEAFATNTFSREVADLEAVLNGMSVGRLGEATLTPPSRIGLVGHSRGAIAVVLVGSRRPVVRAVATWAGLARPGRYAELFPSEADPDRPVEIRNMRTGEILLLRRNVLDDLRKNQETLDPLAALRSGGPPLLVVHGERDEAVSTDDAQMYANAGTDAELFVLESTGHTFDVRHPYAGSTPALERAIARTAAHFRKHLLPKEL
jgi:pimeloyl-ACP methyl ester carboxylesterase